MIRLDTFMVRYFSIIGAYAFYIFLRSFVQFVLLNSNSSLNDMNSDRNLVKFYARFIFGKYFITNF